jgi:peptidoglycan-associated lipoprotein
MEKSVVAILVLLALSACSSSPKTIPFQAPQPAKISSNAESATLSPMKTDSKGFADQLQELQKESVYFDFDKYSIKPEYQNVIQKEAQFIKEHRNDVVTVAGNADERGSSEYNLALGDKRANAARKDLELLGVPESQIKVISQGEDKPRLLCHEEKCWQENRRDDFSHQIN